MVAKKEEPTRLAKASANELKLSQADGYQSQYSIDPTRDGVLYIQDVDELKVPTEFNKLVKVCRFFYKYDAVAGTVFNKIVDCSISLLQNRRGKCTDDELVVYNSLRPMLQVFYSNACLEYLLSGLVVPEYGWQKVSGSDLSPNLNSRRKVTVPTALWFRDPATVILKRSVIPNKVTVFVNIDYDTIAFIQNNGTYADGTQDSDTYEELLTNYKPFVDSVKKLKGGNMKVQLPDTRIITSRMLSESTYPIPYMTNALEPLMHKRNMRRMDYSLASRVIGAIQLIKLGDKDFPCTDPSDFTDIKAQMTYATIRGPAERIFQLFANHTLQIEWVAPDTAAMLNKDKYGEVDEDILAGLGFPHALITGETTRSNSAGASDFAHFSPLATMESIRSKFLDWTVELYKEIKDKNGFKNVPVPSFSPLKLYKLADLNAMGMALYQEGTMSRTTRLEQFGLDLDTEIEHLKTEQEEYKENGLSPAPAMPFSPAQPTVNPTTGKENGAKIPTPKGKNENPKPTPGSAETESSE